MRKVRVQFNNVNGTEALMVLTTLMKLGTVHIQHFDSKGVGYGEVVLCTDLTNRQLQEQLGTLLPTMMTGVEDLDKEVCHDCPVAA